MKNLIIRSILAATVALPGTAWAKWTTSEPQFDEMEGRTIVRAFSPVMRPITKHSPPYDDIEVRIVFECDSDDANDVTVFEFGGYLPELIDETVLGRKFGTGKIRVKWDDNRPENLEATTVLGKGFMFTEESIIEKLIRHNTVLLGMKTNEGGNIYIRFDLKSATAAINSARKICGLPPYKSFSL